MLGVTKRVCNDRPVIVQYSVVSSVTYLEGVTTNAVRSGPAGISLLRIQESESL